MQFSNNDIRLFSEAGINVEKKIIQMIFQQWNLLEYYMIN